MDHARLGPKGTRPLAVLNDSGVFVGYAALFNRADASGDIIMPGYSTVDLAYSRRFGPLQAKFALDNLFDKNYEQFVGFPARERRLRVELRAEF